MRDAVERNTIESKNTGKWLLFEIAKQALLLSLVCASQYGAFVGLLGASPDFGLWAIVMIAAYYAPISLLWTRTRYFRVRAGENPKCSPDFGRLSPGYLVKWLFGFSFAMILNASLAMCAIAWFFSPDRTYWPVAYLASVLFAGTWLAILVFLKDLWDRIFKSEDCDESIHRHE